MFFIEDRLVSADRPPLNRSVRPDGPIRKENWGFQEYAHADGELRRSSQDVSEEFFRCTAIGGLAFPPAIKGLRPAGDVLFGGIADSSRAYPSVGRGLSEL